MNENIKTIVTFRKDLRCRQLISIVANALLIILLVATLSFMTSVIVGWCEGMKVEGALSQTILISLMIILIAISLWVVYQMLLTEKNYRTAIIRVDLLILKMKLKVDGEKENEEKHDSVGNGWIERELQLIGRVLESYGTDCMVGN